MPSTKIVHGSFLQCLLKKNHSVAYFIDVKIPQIFSLISGNKNRRTYNLSYKEFVDGTGTTGREIEIQLCWTIFLSLDSSQMLN